LVNILNEMRYIKVLFLVRDVTLKEILMAQLSEINFEGFEETDAELLCYIPETEFDKQELTTIADGNGIKFTTEVIEPKNWNEEWERNFEPVIVKDFCTVRADFHTMAVTTPYEIIITPKMSFGTGHHATTQLMLEQMRHLNLTGKNVLDFGTGTGILAIMAEKLGAASILAIDNDEWSVENTVENAERNHCSHLTVKQGSLEITTAPFDIILANINRHILLHYMADLYKLLPTGGTILMSGLLVNDKDIITGAAGNMGFTYIEVKEQNGWIAILFGK
jgi:ribosomal protein L11 methyltransferase